MKTHKESIVEARPTFVRWLEEKQTTEVEV